LPVVVCAPLHVCDLTLQPGEIVNDINIGDGVRWQITPAMQGAGDGLTTHVLIKPTDIGLVTNLCCISAFANRLQGIPATA
jgi:type IV secretion system protein VirB9